MVHLLYCAIMKALRPTVMASCNPPHTIRMRLTKKRKTHYFIHGNEAYAYQIYHGRLSLTTLGQSPFISLIPAIIIHFCCLCQVCFHYVSAVLRGNKFLQLFPVILDLVANPSSVFSIYYFYSSIIYPSLHFRLIPLLSTKDS
jgi:hypothetical protein